MRGTGQTLDTPNNVFWENVNRGRRGSRGDGTEIKSGMVDRGPNNVLGGVTRRTMDEKG